MYCYYVHLFFFTHFSTDFLHSTTFSLQISPIAQSWTMTIQHFTDDVQYVLSV